jgi:hypothetical protein
LAAKLGRIGSQLRLLAEGTLEALHNGLLDIEDEAEEALTRAGTARLACSCLRLCLLTAAACCSFAPRWNSVQHNGETRA